MQRQSGEGKQHSQAHTPEFLKETLNMAHQLTDSQLLIRLDSGNDAAENYGILIEDGSWFIVKRNPRKESKEAWLNEFRGCCKDIRHPREGKVVYVGSTWKKVNYMTETGEAKSIDMRITHSRPKLQSGRGTNGNKQINAYPRTQFAYIMPP